MTWQKGASGNPKGRPGKDRALTALLQAAGGKRVRLPDGDERVIRKQLAVENIWDLAAHGRCEFDGRRETLYINGRDYVELIKWIWTQVDGPVPTKLEHSSDPDAPLTIRVEYDDPEPIAARIGPALTATTLLAGPNFERSA